MGLLAALYFHKYKEGEKYCNDLYPEVEYQLYSWGEIYPFFLGDREHSIAARYILRDFPFKLFSSSTPYNSLPQKLCLTFKAPYEVKKEAKNIHVSNIFANEIAKEFAAFLSLVTRRRVFVDRQTRYNGLPIEQKTHLYEQSHSQENQRLKEIEPKEVYQLLENLQAMDKPIANGFILAMRLYHSAVEMMYTEPEFSYFLLVVCLEAISSVVCKDYRPSDEEEFLDSRFQCWRDLQDALTPEMRIRLKETLLRGEYFTFQKVLKFISENIPECFWRDTEDDAKPDYLSVIIDGLDKERIQHSDIAIHDQEKVEKQDLKNVFRDIYEARSKLIHQGIRLPSSIMIGHFRLIPAEAVEEIIQEPILKIPPLLTFERLVSYTLVEFLRKQGVNVSTS